jgi:hypothetical protein
MLSADPEPDAEYVPSFGLRMVCTRCGAIGTNARPNWKERPDWESLTGEHLAGASGFGQYDSLNVRFGSESDRIAALPRFDAAVPGTTLGSRRATFSDGTRPR